MHPPHAHPRHVPWPRHTLLAVGVSLLVTVAVLAPAVRLYFHADDFEWLRAAAQAQERRDVALPPDVNAHFRPAPELLWLLEYRAFGLDAAPDHAIAIALHALVALLVGLGSARLTGSAWGGLLGGLYFGINVSARTVPLWLSASADLLLGLGAAAALAGFSGALRPRILGAVGFALALLAKESGLVLPLVVLLVTPWMARRNKLRWLLVALSAGIAVPHVVAALFSTYLGGRFALGTHVPRNLLVLASSLIVPPLGTAAGALGEPGSPARITLGLAALAVVLALAAMRLGVRTALRFAAALGVTLVLPALAHGELEPRWLYLPWVVLAPVQAAAVIEVGNLLARRLGKNAIAVTAAVLALGHSATHGALVRAKIARDRARDGWVRGIVEGAATNPPRLASGATIEVMVPYGAELRSWPIGIELALGQAVVVHPVDDREGPGGTVPLLDATVTPARWSATGSGGVLPAP